MNRLDKALNGPMRQHMKKQGNRYVPKASYNTLEQAHAAAAKQNEKSLHAYRCGICRSYHLGHL